MRVAALARNDLREIRDRARELGEDAHRRVLDQLDLVVDRLRAFPRGAPPVDGFPGVRRARMHRLPYGVFYRLDGEDLLILRVLHTRRDPAELT